ncbi:serine/threonine protein kinase [Nesterenkonia massiliensis]|uniref:non-specific serine/threonine protein kinase n=1 Tax=Nesterenkonia massiliensis TaxID=1232429 RepID=A0ABT2HMH1_9MICC|nr:serine/threonine-protein kinase [Nesterenkonia massiliensis]MCT1605880.1 serine/threonine protein kinase [Nesterenkonia massiliensis]
MNVVDRYQLHDVIGVGSFATVHRAYDPLLDDTVVVKVLAENHSLNPEIRERFIAEGRSLRKVASRHVVSVHDIGESPRQQPFLVLEYADRGTLAERIRSLRAQQWRARPADVLAVARPLAAALEAVHGANLVHRDLSPSNLLLTSDAQPRSLNGPEQLDNRQPDHQQPSALIRPGESLLLSDLGMCKDLAINSGLTVSGGTAGFRPPEQNTPGVVDTRADIWAATALLRWLSEGADLPSSFQKVLKRGLAVRPERRHRDIAEWLSDCENALAPEPEPDAGSRPVAASQTDTSPSPGAGNGSVAEQKTGHSRRSWVLRLAVVAVAALLGLVGGVLLSHNPGPASSQDGVSLSIAGPEQVSIGEPAQFEAEVTGADSWVWILPTGRHVADEDQVQLTPTAPGTAELILRTTTSDGAVLETVHGIRVTE